MERRHYSECSPAGSATHSGITYGSTAIDRRDQDARRRSQGGMLLMSSPQPSLKEGRADDEPAMKQKRAHSASTLPTVREGCVQRGRIDSAFELTQAISDGALDTSSARRSSPNKSSPWVPGWNFAGSEPLESVCESDSLLPGGTETRRMSRLDSVIRIGNGVARRLSSISQSVSEFHRALCEPSHETNFPPDIIWPDHGGRKTTISVYGTVDLLDDSEMRLLTPCGARRICLSTQKSEAGAALAQKLALKLQDGDILCEVPKSGRKSTMVLRGDMQDCMFNCHRVAVVPLDLSRPDMPSPYSMNVKIY